MTDNSSTNSQEQQNLEEDLMPIPKENNENKTQEDKSCLSQVDKLFRYVLTPLLFYADVISDILLLSEFHSQSQSNYFALLLISLILERFVNFILCCSIKPKKENKKSLKIVYCLSSFFYIDGIWDVFEQEDEIYDQLSESKKMIEFLLEDCPCFVINVIGMFELGIGQVGWIQTFSFFITVFCLCFSTLTYKMAFSPSLKKTNTQNKQNQAENNENSINNPQNQENQEIQENNEQQLQQQQQQEKPKQQLSFKILILSFFYMFGYCVCYSFLFGAFSDISSGYYGVWIYVAIFYGIVVTVNIGVFSKFPKEKSKFVLIFFTYIILPLGIIIDKVNQYDGIQDPKGPFTLNYLLYPFMRAFSVIFMFIFFVSCEDVSVYEYPAVGHIVFYWTLLHTFAWIGHVVYRKKKMNWTWTQIVSNGNSLSSDIQQDKNEKNKEEQINSTDMGIRLSEQMSIIDLNDRRESIKSSEVVQVME